MCIAISLETSRNPSNLRPCMSTTTRSSTVIMPLHRQVGVASTRRSSSRTEILPSVAATNPLSCSDLPSRTISWRTSYAVMMQYCRGRRIKGNRARKAVWLYYPTFRRIANKYTCSAAYNRAVLVSEFDFHLPEELIAQQPLADRAASRMLHLDRNSGAFQDTGFREFPNLLRPGDLLV